MDIHEAQCWGIERVYPLDDDQLNQIQRQEITKFARTLLQKEPTITLNKLISSILKECGVPLSMASACRIRQQIIKNAV
jgi:hypothetical protein